MVLEYNGVSYKSGQDLVCTINGVTLISKLFIRSKSEFYICHNERGLNGNRSPNMLGFDYSWVFHKRGDELSDDVVLVSPLLDRKENLKISDKLSCFLKMVGKYELSSFMASGNFLPDYNEFDTSTNKGMLVIRNSNKNREVEMKIGRFINTLSNSFDFYNISEKEVESIHNSYILYQQDDYLNTIRDVKGKDILKYYTKSNYCYDSTGCRLFNSCMNDNLDYLEMYTSNSAVSLIAVEQLGKVVGRCLVWELKDGRKLMDRRYTSFDWVDNIFDKIKDDEGYLNFDTPERDLEILLDNCEFEKYPFLDTFRYMCKDTKTLFNNYKNSNYKYILDRTGGNFVNR